MIRRNFSKTSKTENWFSTDNFFDGISNKQINEIKMKSSISDPYQPNKIRLNDYGKK